jgi:GT2 family glycosyltransferase
MMANSPLVYVITLTHNHCDDTLQALDSLSRMVYPSYELLVVDNQSTDGTVDRVREEYPEVELLVNRSNLGFAAGINPGLQYALDRGADFVLAINNDVFVAPPMLTHLVAAMKRDVGAAAPMIYYLEDPKRIWSIGFSRHPLLLEMRGGARGQIDEGQWQIPFEVDYLLGCAMLLNSSTLREVGLFDERYFFYREDFDFSLRVRQHGYRLITVPQAKMWHKVGGSAGMESAFGTYQMARGSVIFLRTHTRGLQRPASFLFRSGSALKNSYKFLASRRYHLLRHYWRGLWDGWRAS